MKVKTLRKKANWHLKNDSLTTTEKVYLSRWLSIESPTQKDIETATTIIHQLANRDRKFNNV